MNSNQQPDRSAISLLREPGFLRRNLTVIVSKAASLAILASLVLTAWVAFSFVRISLAGNLGDVSAGAGPEPVPPGAPAKPGDVPAAAVNLAKREPLVYITEGDATHFHLCGHNPTGAERQAIPAGLARSRGFSPCQACFRQ
jgi:hypothetical protein